MRLLFAAFLLTYLLVTGGPAHAADPTRLAPPPAKTAQALMEEFASIPRPQYLTLTADLAISPTLKRRVRMYQKRTGMDSLLAVVVEEPVELKGLKYIVHRGDKTLKTWIYLPGLGQTRRFDTTKEPLLDSDIYLEDILDVRPSDYTFAFEADQRDKTVWNVRGTKTLGTDLYDAASFVMDRENSYPRSITMLHRGTEQKKIYYDNIAFYGNFPMPTKLRFVPRGSKTEQVIAISAVDVKTVIGDEMFARPTPAASSTPQAVRK